MLKFRFRAVLRKFGLNISRVHPDADPGYFLSWLCKKLKVNVIVDVGANTGQFGIRLRASGYKGRIYSFEPVTSFYRELVQVSARDKLWTVFNFAIGAEDGVLPINVAEDPQLSSFLTPSSYGRSLLNMRTKTTETVSVKRLDSLFESLIDGVERPVVLLKTDTQGWDMDVLQGAFGCLDRVSAIAIEASLQQIYKDMTPMLTMIPHLQGLGFEVAAIFPISRDSRMRLVECDCVMVRC